MKNNYSIAQRNEIVEDHLWCIGMVMKKNAILIRAARMDMDDVYQQLAIRLIRAVAAFDPDKGDLKQHIFAQLQYEMLSCKDARRLTGVTNAPTDFRGKVISLDAMREAREASTLYESITAA